MAASQHPSTSSSTDSTTERTQQQASAGPAGAQQLFDAWVNAWRSLGMPATAPGGAFQMPQMPAMPAMPDFTNAAAAMAPFAGLKLPTAAIPSERLQKLQADYSREAMQLIQQAADAKPKVPELKDRRFSAEAWSATPAYAFTAAWYLLNARYLQELVEALDTEPKVRERIRFAVQQWSAAASPSNFFALNPEAQKTLLDSKGESLRQGVTNLLGDLQRGKISQTDESRFVVGKNLANTEGSVVFENDLIQLIQYKPRTASVRERPLLIVPPCINKFYILDLQPENSLVAHGLDSGHQVFLVSWRNADASIAHKTWDDYTDEGVLTAIETVRKISGREQINTLGFCVGGTMLATALAVAAARGEHPAASMTLLTAMLDLTRVANGKLRLSLETVDVHDVIDSVLELFRSEIQVKQQDVHVDKAAQHHYVLADRARLQQMLWNLIRNAAKFTPDGGHIYVRTRDERMHVQISIEDTGIGIEPEQIGKLFNAFEQGNQNMTRQFGGLGLGLAITKALTDVHGGTVTAQSPGAHCGATFTITLPTAARPVEEVVAPEPTVGHQAGLLTILLIEDHEDTAEVMAQLIRGLGHDVTVVGLVADALAATQSNTFDLIVSDVGLPDGTGLDFIKAFREHSDVPAVALTGFGTDEDVRRCLGAGFSSHLTKPVNFGQLEQLIDSAANVKAEKAARADST